MSEYTYELFKYVTVEADSQEEAERLMWERVEQEGSEDLTAELSEVDGRYCQ